MNVLRRNILKGATAAGTLAVATGLFGTGNAFAAYNTAAFSAKSVADALKGMGAGSPAESKDITIKAPDIAENGAVVPVEITSKIAGTTGIAIMAEKNANPLVASFKLENGAEAFVSTRIKMGQTAMVRAVVTAGGKTYTAAKEVKVTIGGCGG
ncbi:thiosulfate oxidation carrier protein SoxY [Sulfuriferula sp. AH1]|uniref:thiosulfate oxidation carrier protein SoxY n=1 Tax=Sulfuriferula sp. AH1 TaxID=1985873 RepID=UPI000B3BAAF6|nr:thiosulfate oxidation carrier protein SoxY [Sulfuriferula sp. AH1]ARU32479.1 thiosulfate oxidation carrier protein SoxY [Sulfuriferula sp. AH1]